MSVPVRRALYGKMAGHTPLTSLLAPAAGGLSKALYHQVAPAGAGLPYVIYFKAAGTPRYTYGELAFDNEIWTIKGVAEGQNAADLADNIAFQLDELLTSRHVVGSDGDSYATGRLEIRGTPTPQTATVPESPTTAQYPFMRREADVEYSEVADGVLYAHAGANYRLIYQSD